MSEYYKHLKHLLKRYPQEENHLNDLVESKYEQQIELFRKEVMPAYRIKSKMYIDNGSLPFHVEEADRTSAYKLSSLEQEPAKMSKGYIANIRAFPKHSVTVTPISREEKFGLLSLSRRIKMKLHSLYSRLSGVFKAKPLTASERAKKAFLDPNMTIAKVYGRSN